MIHRNQRDQGKISLQVAKDPATTMSIVMYFTRNFYLKNLIDEKLRCFDSSGLIQFWTSKHADKRFLNNQSGIDGPQQLSLDNLFGIFFILLIGSCIGLVIFVFEVTMFRMEVVRGRKTVKLSTIAQRNVLHNSPPSPQPKNVK